MKVGKKVINAYDRRQRGYEATLRDLNSGQRSGYRRPGSKNPRKAGK